jgi:hypothetical protein
MFAKFYMLKSRQGTKKTSSKMLWTKLVDKRIYNIPLNIAHLIAPKKKKNPIIALHSCTPRLQLLHNLYNSRFQFHLQKPKMPLMDQEK